MAFSWVAIGIAIASACVGVLFRPALGWCFVASPSLVLKSRRTDDGAGRSRGLMPTFAILMALVVLVGILLVLVTLAAQNLPLDNDPRLWIAAPFIVGMIVGRKL